MNVRRASCVTPTPHYIALRFACSVMKKKGREREEIAKRWTERSGDFLIKRAGIRPLWRHVDQHIYYAHSEGPKGGIGIHNYLYL
jgi:hypothetical protein